MLIFLINANILFYKDRKENLYDGRRKAWSDSRLNKMAPGKELEGLLTGTQERERFVSEYIIN